MANFQDRVTKLEQRHRPRQPGLSSERRKFITDKAVRESEWPRGPQSTPAATPTQSTYA
jgi:hypothetical protein